MDRSSERRLCFFRNEHLLKLKENNRGSVAVLIAMAFTVLVGFAALVTDYGILYAKHAHLQNAMDAAALAGVKELPQNPGGAQAIAEDYAAKNNVSSIDVSFAASNAEIIVSAHEIVPTYLATIWGISTQHLGATAKALLVPPRSLSHIAPLSIEEQALSYGTVYQLKVGAGSGTSGMYLPLQLSGTGAQNYQDDLEFGYSGVIGIGQILDVQHGNISGNTADAVNYRLSQDTRIPPNTFDNYDPNAPEIIYIPVIRVITYSNNSIQQVEVVGFAAFFLEGVQGMGNDSIVTGRFIQTTVSNSQTSGSVLSLAQEEQNVLQGDAGFGLSIPKLLQ